MAIPWGRNAEPRIVPLLAIANAPILIGVGLANPHRPQPRTCVAAAGGESRLGYGRLPLPARPKQHPPVNPYRAAKRGYPGQWSVAASRYGVIVSILRMPADVNSS